MEYLNWMQQLQHYEKLLDKDMLWSKLEIDPATIGDQGIYACVANNEHGVMAKNFKAEYTYWMLSFTYKWYFIVLLKHLIYKFINLISKRITESQRLIHLFWLLWKSSKKVCYTSHYHTYPTSIHILTVIKQKIFRGIHSALQLKKYRSYWRNLLRFIFMLMYSSHSSNNQIINWKRKMKKLRDEFNT